MNPSEAPSTVTLVAGEASGDQLGAALINAIRVQNPNIRFTGIGGPLMEAAGMECWWSTDQLSVMGLFEVAQHIPRLLALRKQLVQRVSDLRPAVFIGIDAPDFNLGVEKRLKARAIPVIHYVSPTVWAWRPGRVKTIAKATERVLCLFPFEPGYYSQQPVKADYTGHPLADEISLQVDTLPAREALGLSTGQRCIALLPGSRLGEVEKLSAPMLDAAARLSKRYPDLSFVIPAATELIGNYLESQMSQFPGLNCRVFAGRGKEVISAADVVICASGTATLEVMLINRPMVVCYRLAPMTYRMVKWFKLIKSRFFSLPNILASEELVPELLQQEVNGERIANEVSIWLEHPERCSELKRRFDLLHRQLMTGAAATAATAVLNHIACVDEQS
jgi:lipid-A-disaccharide synthase